MKSKYEVVLNTSGRFYEAGAETIDEAIAGLGLSWEQIKAKGEMTVSDGENRYTHLFYLSTLRRIFANKVVRFVWAKRLKLLLDANK